MIADEQNEFSLAINAVSEEALCKVALLFNSFKQIRIEGPDATTAVFNTSDDTVLSRAFDIHLQTVLGKLENRLKSQTNPTFRNIEIIMAKHGLFDAAFQQAISVAYAVSRKFGESLKELRSVQASFVTEMQQCSLASAEFLMAMKLELDSSAEYIRTLEHDFQKISKYSDELRLENMQNKRRISELEDRLHQSMKENSNLKDTQESTKLQSSKLDSHAISKRRTRSFSDNNIPGNFSFTMSPPKVRSRPESVTERAARTKDSESVMNISRHSVANSKGPLSVTAPLSWLTVFRSELQKAIDGGRCRDISLKECKEAISRLYESKAIANDKAMQGVGNIPMETLEQHVYRTMEKKYGLRTLALEHAGMLLQAVDSYCRLDNEVEVFQKIFRNEIEEDFRLVQKELLQSIRDLCLAQIMLRNPNKDRPTVNAILEKTMSSGYICENEWKEMVGYLYNEEDSSAICRDLRRSAIQYQAKSPSITAVTVMGINNDSSERSGHELGYDKQNAKDVKRLGYSSATLKIEVPPEPEQRVVSQKQQLKLPYFSFVQSVLGYQLRSHEDFLGNFLRIFRNSDTDADGVLTAGQFKDCFLELRAIRKRSKQALDVYEEPNAMTENESKIFLTLIKDLDPFETDRIVFSAAVSCINKINFD